MNKLLFLLFLLSSTGLHAAPDPDPTTYRLVIVDYYPTKPTWKFFIFRYFTFRHP